MADGTDTPAWATEYESRQPVFGRVAAEVEFALETLTRQEEIKTHSVTSRVKELPSLIDKCREKEIDDPFIAVDDLVGIRIVVLFLSDLPRVDALIRSTFDVHESENKVTDGDPASFGYMSVHYIATLKEEHSGPRYDDLKGLRFEIQARTIVMDAWANVAHYLDYKGESSVPEDLRKDFFALSGLFYVADQHFELFADRAGRSRKQAEEDLESNTASDLDINLDTMEAFLVHRYSDRMHEDRPAISDLVEDVTRAGYGKLGALEAALDSVESQFLEREVAFPPGGGMQTPGGSEPRRRFTDVGAVRISLRMLGKLPPAPNYGPVHL